MVTEHIKNMCFYSDVSASEVLRSLISEGHDISDDQIAEVLQWSGDDEFATVKDIRGDE